MSGSAFQVAVGTVLDGRYQIVREIGRGGMSSVYLAEHSLIGRRVAVKVLHAEVAGSAESVARFMAEARTVGTLGHPNVVTSTDMGYLPDGRPYLILEYLEGGSLAEELERGGALPFQRAVHIAMQIAAGVGAAHDRGIVHRDLKSDNVFLARSEHAVDQVKVLDFGISKFLQTPLETGQTQRGIILGTPEFMAPEQIHSPELVDHRADIYALGTILHHMLTGRTPFENTPAPKLWNRILHDPPPPITGSNVPGSLAEVIQRTLAKDPADRPQSMLQLYDELAPLGFPAGSVRGSTPMIARPPSYFPRHRPLPLEAGQDTPLPGPMTFTQAEHTSDSQPDLLAGRRRPRLASPQRGELPAPAPVQLPWPGPGAGPGSAQHPYTPRPSQGASPGRRQSELPTVAVRAPAARRARRVRWGLAMTLVLLGAGAGAWWLAVRAGSRAAVSPEAATGSPSTAVALAEGDAPPAASQPDASGSAAGARGVVDTAVEEVPRVQGEIEGDEIPPDPVATAAGHGEELEPTPESAEGPDAEEGARERRRRRRRERRQRRREASSRRERARAAGSDERAPGNASERSPGVDAVAQEREVTADREVARRGTTAPEAGRVDVAATRRVVRAHLGEIRTCHERGRMDHPGLRGRVAVRITIGRRGRVLSTAIASSTLDAPAVDRCITSAVEKWKFPAPVGGDTAVIVYPFALR